jgi:hypothetical protein
MQPRAIDVKCLRGYFQVMYYDMEAVKIEYADFSLKTPVLIQGMSLVRCFHRQIKNSPTPEPFRLAACLLSHAK